MPGMAATYASTPGSRLQEMAMIARGIEGALHLEIGDPDFTTPAHIIDGAAAAAHAGFTHYAPAPGLESLRELIAAKVTERNRFPCAVENVAVTTGAAGGIFSSLLILLDPGDDVLIPDPGWPTYPAMAHVLGARPVPYPLDPARGFTPNLEALERLLTPRTKVLVVNSPGNPTGAVFSIADLRALHRFAVDHDLWVISDECYDEIMLEGEHVSFGVLGDLERVIVVFTFSKTYAMTGWRIGYVVAGTPLAQAVAKAQRPVVSTASTISQKGAEAALAGSQHVVSEMVAAYRSRRDLVLSYLDEGGVPYIRPRGAFYVFANISAAGKSVPFARNLLTSDRVSVVPGSAFGPQGEGFVRISLAASEATIRVGIPLLVAAATRNALSTAVSR
jgi:aspartate/methionine/tyrosine aminotransferase